MTSLASFDSENLFIGLDLSTQQLKGLLITEESRQPVALITIDFDKDLPQYKTTKGVYYSSLDGKDDGTVRAPIEMWLDAIDLFFEKLTASYTPDVLSRIKGISGACQQHASVFWNLEASSILKQNNLKFSQLLQTESKGKKDDTYKEETLKSLITPALSWELSPNWQDFSTKAQCEKFTKAAAAAAATTTKFGNSKHSDTSEISIITGSKAHLRFTGPQILKVIEKSPDIYHSTSRISLASSFLATVLADNVSSGSEEMIEPLDLSDACGMNLWDIQNNKWSDPLTQLIDKMSGRKPFPIKEMLGNPLPPWDSSKNIKTYVKHLNPYFLYKYGTVLSSCRVIIPFTGDNPATLLSMGLAENDFMVSLGTSTTVLGVTSKYQPSDEYHIFQHPMEPVDEHKYMVMVCYSNGSLARERVRDRINEKYNYSGSDTWAKFNEIGKNQLMEKLSKPEKNKDCLKVGFYFPVREIAPSVSRQYRYFVACRAQNDTGYEIREEQQDDSKQWNHPDDDVLGIIESQALSIASRISRILQNSTNNGNEEGNETIMRPRRIYFVGGGSQNELICKVMTLILNPTEGAYTQTTDSISKAEKTGQEMKNSNSCAFGAALKAIYIITSAMKRLDIEDATEGRMMKNHKIPHHTGETTEKGKKSLTSEFKNGKNDINDSDDVYQLYEEFFERPSGIGMTLTVPTKPKLKQIKVNEVDGESGVITNKGPADSSTSNNWYKINGPTLLSIYKECDKRLYLA